MPRRSVKSNKNQNILKILLFIMIAVLIFNPGAVTIFKHFLNQKRLTNGIERFKVENENLKNEIINLQTNSAYLAMAIKREYKLISDGEIEYRFKI